MNYYCYILLALHVFSIGVSTQKGGTDFLSQLASFGMYLPILGRVLNWW